MRNPDRRGPLNPPHGRFNPRVEAPNPRVATPNPQVRRSNPPVAPPNPRVERSSPPVERSNPRVKPFSPRVRPFNPPVAPPTSVLGSLAQPSRRPTPCPHALFLATGTVLLLSALALQPAAAQPAAANAADIAGQVMQALGGKEAWDATHYLRFTFAGRRTHHWDKWTGRHRLEGQTPEGKKYVVLHNLNTRQGTSGWTARRPRERRSRSGSTGRTGPGSTTPTGC